MYAAYITLEKCFVGLDVSSFSRSSINSFYHSKSLRLSLLAEPAGDLHREKLKAQKVEKLKVTPLLLAGYNNSRPGALQRQSKPARLQVTKDKHPVSLEMPLNSCDVDEGLAALAKVLWETYVLLDQQLEARWDLSGISDVPKHLCFGNCINTEMQHSHSRRHDSD